MPKNLQLGAEAENLARKLLESKGFTFLTRNFRTSFGEIDLIFRDYHTTVFVEVKAREDSTLGLPEEAVTPQKLKIITKVGEYFLQKYPGMPQLARIDVVALDLSHVPPRVTHHRSVSS